MSPELARFNSNDGLINGDQKLQKTFLGPIDIKTYKKQEMNQTWYPNISTHANKVRLL